MIWNQHLLYQIIDVWYHIRKLYLINNEKNDKIKLNRFFYKRRPIWSDQPINDVYFGQVDESWYPAMKHQMKTRCVLMSKDTCVYIKITITKAKISILLFIVISLLILVTVFDAILTSRQTREKLQWLYENLMSNNLRRTAVLKKIWLVN